MPDKLDSTNLLNNNINSGIKLSGYSVILNFILAIVKMITGIAGYSYALIADGIESLLDVFSSLIVWFGLKYSLKPPDEDHPYGHGKAEQIAGLTTAIFIIIAALLISVLSVIEILTPHRTPENYTLIVLSFIIILKETLYRRLKRKSLLIKSKALLNDAWHHRSDALTSIAAFIGISIAIIGGKGFEVADDWAALLACSIIFYNGFRLMRSSISEIMDGSPAAEYKQKVSEIVLNTDGVLELETCRIRKSGLKYLLDLHITVSANLSVKEGHYLAHQVKDNLMISNLQIQDVAVHVEPDEFE